MIKWLVRILIAIVVLIVLAAAAVNLLIDSGVQRGIEKVGPMLTKVDIKLDGVHLSLLSGSGTIKGLVVGNPVGFKSPSAIRVTKASMALEARSVFADKMVIRSINVQSPEITYETDFKGNNLSKILENVEAATAMTKQAPTTEEEKKAQRKLQVDEFLVSGGKVNVSVTALGGRSVSVPLPEIHLKDLGQGPEGITAAELTKEVLRVIEREAVRASAGAVADLSKQAGGVVNDAAEAAATLKGIGDLFKKK